MKNTFQVRKSGLDKKEYQKIKKVIPHMWGIRNIVQGRGYWAVSPTVLNGPVCDLIEKTSQFKLYFKFSKIAVCRHFQNVVAFAPSSYGSTVSIQVHCCLSIAFARTSQALPRVEGFCRSASFSASKQVDTLKERKLVR